MARMNEVPRRGVLKALSAGSITTGLAASNVAATQNSYDVSLHTSDGLYNEDAATPINRASEYVQGAFNDITPAGNVVKRANQVPTPVERHKKSFEVDSDPCFGNPAQYEGIRDWWKNYGDCVGSDIQDDANVLILRDHSGGIARSIGAKYCVASGGHNLDDMPSGYNKYLGNSYPGIVNTILEEIGHCHQISPQEKEYHHERTGHTLEALGNYYMTAIDHSEDENECGAPRYNVDGNAHTWSNCTFEDYWY